MGVWVQFGCNVVFWGLFWAKTDERILLGGSVLGSAFWSEAGAAGRQKYCCRARVGIHALDVCTCF